MNKKILYTMFFTIILLGNFLISQEGEASIIDEPIVSIHAEDTHLPTILSILAKQSDYNIVTGPNVDTQEKLTIHLDEVPISQAINLIIRYYLRYYLRSMYFQFTDLSLSFANWIQKITPFKKEQ